jgi:hypothetical protein
MRRIALAVSLVLVAAACGGSHSHPSAQGVGGVEASALTQRGIYLGPPGTLPAGVPDAAPPTPATTSGTGGRVASGVELSPVQLAVRGDPADGHATVSAVEAVATARHNLAGFVGSITIGAPKLVQVDYIYVPMVATAWAIPVTGPFEFLAGPAPTGGGPVRRSRPRTTTAVAFVDAVTGRFISEEVF